MQPHPLDPHPEVRLVEVSPRVKVAYGPLTDERWQANATIVLGDRATAVIDGMMTPEQTAPVRAEAERLAGGRPVRWLVLTHADPDHVLGRVTFEGAAVVGSARSAATLRDPGVREAYAGIAARLGGDPATFAMPEVDLAFDARAALDLGGVTLEGVSVGPGHSDSDTLWWCPEERVAWSDAQRRLLEALAGEVGELLRAGASVDEAVAHVRLEAYRDLPMAGERLEAAVRGAAIALGS